MFTKILVPVDGTDPSFNAVETASELAQKFGAHLDALIVVHSASVPAELRQYANVEHLGGSAQEAYQQIADNILAAVRDVAAKHGAEDITCHVRDGDAAEEILAFADANGTDLLVMGTRGHSRLGELLVGSLSHEVTRAAKCASLIVK